MVHELKVIFQNQTQIFAYVSSLAAFHWQSCEATRDNVSYKAESIYHLAVYRKFADSYSRLVILDMVEI